MDTSNSAVWTVAEVAQYLRISRQLVYKMAKAGSIPCFRIGTRVLFAADAIKALTTI